jgi:glutamate-1-semialdehyde 2,1-aminomutase
VRVPPSAGTLAARARAVIPGGVNSGQRQIPGLEDLVVVRTEGCTFEDSAGRIYTDYQAAFGPALLGHNDADVDRAFAREARAVDLMGIGVTPVEIELAEKLVAVVPSLERVLLTVSGSAATFHALRLARAVTDRRHVIKFQGGYHGWHDAVATNVLSRADRLGHKDPTSTGILSEVLDATLIAPFNDLAAVSSLVDEHADDVAAIIVEPIAHSMGAMLPRPGFLEGLRALCTRAGIVLVFDEVVTGFRHAVGGYQSICGVTPDLSTFGKAMANGYPIGAIGGRAALMDEFSTNPGHPVLYAGTFNGHPACAAAALATIAKLEDEPVHEHIFALGERIRRELSALYARLGVPAVVAGYGSIFVPYFVAGDPSSYADLLAHDRELFVGYRRKLIDAGIFELPLNLKRSHVSYAHRQQHVDELIAATELAVCAVLDERAQQDDGTRR